MSLIFWSGRSLFKKLCNKLWNPKFYTWTKIVFNKCGYFYKWVLYSNNKIKYLTLKYFQLLLLNVKQKPIVF